jgi:hypothetical protein
VKRSYVSSPYAESPPSSSTSSAASTAGGGFALSAIVRVSSLEGRVLICPNQLDLSSVADLNTNKIT